MGIATDLPTFGVLWKGMNTTPLPDNAPLVNTPNRSTADLLRQARGKIMEGQDRKKVLGQLRFSTARKPAALAQPKIPQNTSSSPATSSGFGGGGYSGNVASQIGHAGNAGYSTPSAPRPNPNPAPSAAPAAAPAAAPPPNPLPKPPGT